MGCMRKEAATATDSAEKEGMEEEEVLQPGKTSACALIVEF